MRANRALCRQKRILPVSRSGQGREIVAAPRTETADDLLFARVLLPAGRTGGAQLGTIPVHHQHRILAAVFAAERADNIRRVAGGAGNLFAQIRLCRRASPILMQLLHRCAEQRRYNREIERTLAAWRKP
jgi:hypothetical protein